MWRTAFITRARQTECGSERVDDEDTERTVIRGSVWCDSHGTLITRGTAPSGAVIITQHFDEVNCRCALL